MALSIAVLVPSCDTIQGPPETAAGSIEYTLSGGFAGGMHTSLTIDPAGHATLLSSYPPIEDNLKADEQLPLMRYFADIWKQPDTIAGGCIDDFGILIRWTDNRGTKTVRADGCGLNPSNGTHPFPTLEEIVRILNNVAIRIREQKSPWKGVTTSFTVDKASYGLDEPVRFSYKLKNPTTQERSLLFRHADQFWFSITNNSVPRFYYLYPSNAYSLRNSTDTSSPSSIVLQPGEEEELVYIWDRSFTQPNGSSGKIGAGYYHARMGLLGGDLPTQDLEFDIYDPRIPVKGKILPDWAGIDATSEHYTFHLQVTNWTRTSVILHFRNSQRIAIELWDLDVDPPTRVIYRTSISTIHDEQGQTLAPGETVVYSEAVTKSDIAPSYFWTLAKAKLLCTDFELSADAELQIFRQ